MLLHSGCASVIRRVEKPDGRPYPGLKSDLADLRRFHDYGHGGDLFRVPIIADAFDLFETVATLADVPLSAVADTLLIPLDLYLRTQSEFSMLIVDENGKPVPGAWAGRGYYTARAADKQGTIRWPLRTLNRYFDFMAWKDGYYTTHHRNNMESRVSNMLRQEMAEAGTNCVRVVLKKIGRRAGLVHHKVHKRCPQLDEPVAFDLEAGDWVTPHGTGRVADIWVKALVQPTGWERGYTRMEWTFPGPGNGIQELFAIGAESDETNRFSELIQPRVAPEAGYTNHVVFWSDRRDREWANSRLPNRHYMFRVRSDPAATNGAATANVGWIRKDVWVGISRPNNTCAMSFEYFVNTNRQSRALE
jgi:uncharacterized protein YceK